MNTRSFTNVCLLAIICLLAVIVMKIGPGRAYAAEKFQYRVIPVEEPNAPAEILKQTKDGWELVAAPVWTYDEVHARMLLIFRD